jgi:hypothetical protein
LLNILELFIEQIFVFRLTLVIFLVIVWQFADSKMAKNPWFRGIGLEWSTKNINLDSNFYSKLSRMIPMPVPIV